MKIRDPDRVKDPVQFRHCGLIVDIHIRYCKIIAPAKIIPHAGPDPVLVKVIINDLFAEVQHHFIPCDQAEISFFKFFMSQRILQIYPKP